MPWNVESAISSTGVGDVILGERASSKASQNVLPSKSLTKIICSEFSRGAALHKMSISGV